MTGERGDLQGTEQAAEKSLNHVLPLSVLRGKLVSSISLVYFGSPARWISHMLGPRLQTTRDDGKLSLIKHLVSSTHAKNGHLNITGGDLEIPFICSSFINNSPGIKR